MKPTSYLLNWVLLKSACKLSIQCICKHLFHRYMTHCKILKTFSVLGQFYLDKTCNFEETHDT